MDTFLGRMTMTKSFFASKTFWFNVVVIVVEAVQVDMDAKLLSDQHVLILAAIGNLILRLFTKSPVHLA